MPAPGMARPHSIRPALILALCDFCPVAQTTRTRNKELRVQQNNSLSHNNAASLNPATQINSHCRFEHGETDPDPRIRLQLARDCREHEESE
jgi:hypothetical protein